VAFDGTYEDLFCYVEQQIARGCGADVAGRLHVARSRNDIDMTMYRMRQRECILEIAAASVALRRTLADLADRHRETIFAAHTHTQRAQPTTVAHYMLGVIEQLERDFARLKGAFDRANMSPLGACAITGTGFDIDRALTADLLGFSAPTGNTYGSIAAVDYVLEAMSALGVLLVGVGRFVQDLLLWSTAEFDYLRLGDGFVQPSSIMPQKRNPVALEHVRALGSKALGQSQAVTTMLHNTPFGDIVDTEDDLQPLVFSAFRDASRAVALLSAALGTADFDRAGLLARSGEGWTTLTELADTLVRDRGLPFSTAREIAVRLMQARADDPNRPLAVLLAEVSAALLEAPIVYSDNRLEEVLSPRHFVNVRRTFGGPAPEIAADALSQSRRQIDADERWRRQAAAALAEAHQRLMQRAAAL